MFNFDLKQAGIYQALKWEDFFVRSGFFKKVFKFFFIFLFLFFWLAFLTEAFPHRSLSLLLGSLIILLTLFVFFFWEGLFFEQRLKNPELKVKIGEAVFSPEKHNLAELLSFAAARAVFKATRFAKSRKLAGVNSSVLFYFLLLDNRQLNFIFSRINFDLEEAQKRLKQELPACPVGRRGLKRGMGLEPINYSSDFQKTILVALETAHQREHQRIRTGDILIGLLKNNPLFKEILVEAGLNIRDVANLVWWFESLAKKTEEEKRWWESKNLAKKGTLAKEWAAGYTITLDKYSVDWSEVIKEKGFEEIIGHEKEVESAERTLSCSGKNSILLVGEPGVGRGSIIQALAQRSFLGLSSDKLNYKRVVELDIASLISGVGERERVEETLNKIFQEVASAGNVILVIDRFHDFVGGISRLGVLDISGLLVPYLKLTRFQLIAITTYAGLHSGIEKNPSILTFFQKVEVVEISPQETMQVLGNFALRLEAKHKKLITYGALKDVFYYTERYMPNLPFPEKALDLLEETVVYVSRSSKEKLVQSRHVAKIVSEKTEIPVGEIEAGEKNILLNLENLIHQRIINQDEAVKEISSALRRARAEVGRQAGPMGCFLFLGPTGVGKTETAKALAEIYFKSEARMVRLDMSEFQAVKDVERLIGSSEQEGLLTTQIRENPFSLLLLDELEKAHPNILNLFLQVLDEGHLTDNFGRKVNFNSTIIIATSNAGYEVILEALKKKTDWGLVKQKLLDFLFKEGIFRPEFINRFDAMVVFQALTKENLLQIAELMLGKLKKTLEEKGIEFAVSDSLKEKIVELGYNPVFGARDMRRVIQEKVENVLASALLAGELKRGDRITMRPENFEIVRQ